VIFICCDLRHTICLERLSVQPMDRVQFHVGFSRWRCAPRRSGPLRSTVVDRILLGIEPTGEALDFAELRTVTDDAAKR
jgi:hypothetical protein